MVGTKRLARFRASLCPEPRSRRDFWVVGIGPRRVALLGLHSVPGCGRDRAFRPGRSPSALRFRVKVLLAPAAPLRSALHR
jgi:hypothetical protein